MISRSTRLFAREKNEQFANNNDNNDDDEKFEATATLLSEK